MNSDQLIKFIEIVNSKNITEAAKHLHITQSALSHSLATLEDELNGKLFVREKKAVFLTAKGETLYPYALEVVRNINDAITVLNRDEIIRISAIGVCSSFLLAYYPEDKLANISLLQIQEEKMPSALYREKVDLVACDDFYFKYAKIPTLKKFILCREQLCLVVPPNHPFYVRESVSLEELIKAKIIKRSDVESLTSWVERIEQSMNIKFDFALNLDGYTHSLLRKNLPYPELIQVNSIYQKGEDYINIENGKLIRIDNEFSSRFIYAWYLESHTDKIAPLLQSVKKHYKNK